MVAPYDNSKPPAMSLPAGYQLAVEALGSSTNQFHCIGAAISTYYGPPGWDFTFCTTNSPPKYEWVTVEFGGKIHLEDEHSMMLPE